jgi:hypothetical protein
MICHYDPTVGVYRILSLGDHFSNIEAKMERSLQNKTVSTGENMHPPHIHLISHVPYSFQETEPNVLLLK